MSKEKVMKTIQHGRESESWYCRQCGIGGSDTSSALRKAKQHCQKTGHTVDVYYESWREVTKNWRNTNE